MEDEPPNNLLLAQIGGVKNTELNKLELQFLTDIKFSLLVS